MRVGLVRVLLVFAICGVLLAGCGFNRKYSGIAIENAGDISEVIRTSMLHRSYSVKVSFDAYTMNKDELERLIDELVEGALYESDAPNGGDYIRYQYGGYTLRHSEEKKTLKYEYRARIIPSYYTTAEQEEAVDLKVKEIIEGFGLDEGAPDYQKARSVRDYICENVSYDTVHKHLTGSKHIQSTAYSALYYNTALCQGYAVLCYRLLKELGLDARIVTGEAYIDGVPERHAWNIVCIDGKYYNMDVTFDDVFDTEDYFLKADGTFAADHVRDDRFRAGDFIIKYPVAAEDYQI